MAAQQEQPQEHEQQQEHDQLDEEEELEGPTEAGRRLSLQERARDKMQLRR